MRKEGLVYCKYSLAHKDPPKVKDVALPAIINRDSAESLISAGLIETHPIVYEDFLPFSAAGIFQSNLGQNRGADGASDELARPDRNGVETALGSQLLRSDDLYLNMEIESLRNCAESLGRSRFIPIPGK